MKEKIKLEKLKTIRKQKGYSRRELGELSGVSPMTINALERGINDATNVKLSTLISLAKALKVKVKDLVPNDIKKIIA